MNKDTETPEQKALIEKETFEEVAKIKDTQIRNYYMQEMKKRIYYTLGKGAQYNQSGQNIKSAPAERSSVYKATPKRTYSQKQETAYHLVKKPPLTDLFLRKIIAAMVIYPQLIKQYEDKLLSFEIGNSVAAKIVNEIIEIRQETENLDSDILLEKLNLNFKSEMENLWELNMYKIQKTTIYDLQKEIDEGLKEIQLKQIDIDMKECMTLIKNGAPDAEEIYARYQKLSEEKNKFLPQDE